jgi:hypothetical protein
MELAPDVLGPSVGGVGKEGEVGAWLLWLVEAGISG